MAVLPRPACAQRTRVASAVRWAARTAATLAGASALLLVPAQAGAQVTEVEFESAKVKAGITPRNSESEIVDLVRVNELNEGFFNPSPESFANALGHPVVHNAQVFVVYWDPADAETHSPYYHGDWQNVIDTFMREAGGEGGTLRNDVLAVDGQYTDTSNKPASSGLTFRGAYTDTTHYPGLGCNDPRPIYEAKAHKIKPLTCLSDKEIQTELKNFIALHTLPTGMNTIYDILTPPGVTVCLDAGGVSGHCSSFASSIEEQTAKPVGEFTKRQARIYSSTSYKNSFCSYHSDINTGGLETGDANTILYDVIPWTAGGVADGQLAAADQREEYVCQDGGFDPSAKLVGEKESTPAFAYPPEPRGEHPGGELEYEEWGTREKEAWLRAQEPGGPHVEEPNQNKCPSPDGFCDTGLADLIINQIAVEQQNTVTDPLLNAWQDASKHEAADECRNWFAPVGSGFGGGGSTIEEGTAAGSLFNQSIGEHHYYLNSSFNLAAQKLNYPGVGCITGINLQPKFTAPSTVNTEETVSFDGMESHITLGAAAAYNEKGEETTTYAKFTWNFGDGSPLVSGYAPGAPECEAPWLSPCAASALHAYKYGGTYVVTLTVTDVAGNTATAEQVVHVTGPPAPVEGAKEGAKEGGGGSGGSGSGGSGGSGSGSPSTPSSSSGASKGVTIARVPTITEFVLSKSLRKALRGGIAVRYSVSEQVAGRFEVMIPTSLARRLGVHGAAASGLAAGTPPQTTIAKAIIVTTRGGGGTVTIQFGPKTAARLRHLHRVSFTVRLLVRSASGGSAAAIGAVTLSG